jgi:hypothetical protein
VILCTLLILGFSEIRPQCSYIRNLMKLILDNLHSPARGISRNIFEKINLIKKYGFMNKNHNIKKY